MKLDIATQLNLLLIAELYLKLGIKSDVITEFLEEFDDKSAFKELLVKFLAANDGLDHEAEDKNEPKAA